MQMNQDASALWVCSLKTDCFLRNIYTDTAWRELLSGIYLRFEAAPYRKLG